MENGKIISIDETSLKCSLFKALEENGYNGMIGNLVINEHNPSAPVLYNQVINENDCNYFKRVLLTNTIHSSSPIIVGYRIKLGFSDCILRDFDMSGDFAISSGFSKLVLNNPPSRIRLDSSGNTHKSKNVHQILNQDQFITLDISRKDLTSTLSQFNIDRNKIILNYGSTNYEIVNLRNLYDNCIDLVSLYKIGEYYLLISTSVKTKMHKRKLIYNQGFLNYLINMDDTQLGKQPDHSIKTNVNLPDSNVKSEKIFDPRVIRPSCPKRRGPIVSVEDRSALWVDKMPGVNYLNQLLDKISKDGFDSLSTDEQSFLENM